MKAAPQKMTVKQNGWVRSSMSELCTDITVGIVVKPAALYRETGIRCFRSLNVREGRVNDSDWVFIGKDADQQNTKSRVAAGDILVVRSGAPGTACVVPREFHGSNCIDVVIARPDRKKVYPEFLCEVINSDWAKRQVAKLQGGLAQKHLNVSAFAQLSFLLPPLPEQIKLAEMVAWWDDAIQKQETLLAAKVERKRGLMQQLLTGKTRFREFVKSGKKVKTRYGDFPADWSQAHMGDIADEAGKKNAGGRELPVLSCTKHRGLVNSLEYFGKRIFSEDTSTYRIVERGDFAYATNHVEEGSIGYQNLHDAALISPMYTVFRTRAGVDHEFFWKLIKTELYRHIFEVNTSGSIARRGALRWDEFALIKVFLPSVPEQQRIATVLNTCDREIELLQKQLEALKEQKRGLMQKLLTGEVRVKI